MRAVVLLPCAAGHRRRLALVASAVALLRKVQTLPARRLVAPEKILQLTLSIGKGLRLLWLRVGARLGLCRGIGLEVRIHHYGDPLGRA
jgi:hypothetical protein